ncbi:MAG: SDR family NAD(P)-dependent oxidoreductase [Solirubrobacteraceae bacterium]
MRLEGKAGIAECVRADWTRAAECQAVALSEESFERIIAFNLKGCLLSCQAVVPVMRGQRSGSIVNISQSPRSLRRSGRPRTRSPRPGSTPSLSRSRSTMLGMASA